MLTCGWSVSPGDWTSSLLGSASGQRCSSLSSCVSSPDPLLEMQIWHYLLMRFDLRSWTAGATPDIRRFTARPHGDREESQWHQTLSPSVDNRKLVRWISLSACSTCRLRIQWLMWKWHFFLGGGRCRMSWHDATLSVTKLKHALSEYPCFFVRHIRKCCLFRPPSQTLFPITWVECFPPIEYCYGS